MAQGPVVSVAHGSVAPELQSRAKQVQGSKPEGVLHINLYQAPSQTPTPATPHLQCFLSPEQTEGNALPGDDQQLALEAVLTPQTVLGCVKSI